MTRIWENNGFDEEYPDAAWEFGLRLLLDGVERLVDDAAPGATR